MSYRRYRGRRIDTKQWVVGSLIVGKGRLFQIDTGKIDAFPEMNTLHIVDPVTVGEGSGVKDMYGVEIFEHDVVRGLLFGNTPVDSICEFKKGSFGLNWPWGDDSTFSPLHSLNSKDLCVIGNKFDPDNIHRR